MNSTSLLTRISTRVRRTAREMMKTEAQRLAPHYKKFHIPVDGIEIITSFREKMSILYRLLVKQPVTPFPRTIRMKTFVEDGCLFRITTRIEEIRIENYGDEQEFTGLILDELRPGDVFFDIGGCVGLIAINAAAKGASVWAFEPEPSYRERLEANVALNRFANITVVPWAVSNKAGEATLHRSGPVGEVSPSLEKTPRHGESITIATRDLDSAIAERVLPAPDVMKIDIEGAEILALRGMEKLLSSPQSPRTLFIEIHPEHLQYFDSSADEAISLIESYGYIDLYRRVREGQIHCVFRKQSKQADNE